MKHQYENPFDFEDIFTLTAPLVKTFKCPEHMYNYFTFDLKQHLKNEMKLYG